MVMDYRCLGAVEEVRERRLSILRLYLKGGTPREMSEKLGFRIEDIYNDLRYLRETPLHSLPIDIVRDFGESFYEMKIAELEESLKGFKARSPNWIGVQKLILQYKVEALKLTGASDEHMIHSGEIKIKYAGENIDGEGNND